MDDDELIAALAAGDDTALRELFTRHAPWLAARLRAALPPPDVEDVLQETFLAVWKGAGGYRPRGTPQAWMWVIARNQAGLLLRRRGPVTAPLEEAPRAGPGAAEATLDPAEAAVVRAGITAALNGPEGEVLRLMYVEDRPVAEVAALLGVPAGTVGPGQPLVWLVAPAVAAVGIAFAYGPGIDPAWELSSSCAVPDRMVLLTRVAAVFAVNAVLGLLASAASGAVAALTFGWLLPMTAVCALALAVAVAARSAVVGAGAGVAAWAITVLASDTASGQLTASVTNAGAYLPYLAVAACCAAIVIYATHPERGLQ